MEKVLSVYNASAIRTLDFKTLLENLLCISSFIKCGGIVA